MGSWQPLAGFTSFDGVGRNHIARLLGDANMHHPNPNFTTAGSSAISCGAVNLKLNGTSTIAATEVPGANKYQFRFTNTAGQPAHARTSVFAFPTRSFTPHPMAYPSHRKRGARTMCRRASSRQRRYSSVPTTVPPVP
ncbi:MAG: hypothetical protein IPI07_11715 [Flavobacteriales bacterium]|nr:hypothetical protein [Flavobacteriales bacterium]